MGLFGCNCKKQIDKLTERVVKLENRCNSLEDLINQVGAMAAQAPEAMALIAEMRESLNPFLGNGETANAKIIEKVNKLPD